MFPHFKAEGVKSLVKDMDDTYSVVIVRHYHKTFITAVAIVSVLGYGYAYTSSYMLLFST